VILSVFVPGIPQPGGSKRAFIVAGRANVVDANPKAKSWKSVVATSVASEWGCLPLIDTPIHVQFAFVMPRPKSHFRTGKHAGELRPDAPTWHASKPDVLKLSRSTEDALTGIVWRDDCLIASEVATKRYG
jgi:Holliday junction resolvase RusA-like endonuclease